MPAVSTKYNSGGGDSVPQQGNAKDLATVLRSLIDDIALVKVATIASADATDLATAITLVNEIKTALNAIAVTAPTTTKS